MIKRDLRRIYTDKRKSLSISEINDLSLSISNGIKEFDFSSKEIFHIFMSIRSKLEINTDLIIEDLRAKGKRIVSSKSDFKSNTMLNYFIEKDTEFEISTWDIPEPINAEKVEDDLIDVVFVPLLAFDENGNRVGYGKGFYDRFFKNCREDVIKIGLSLFDACESIEDSNENDVKLNYCISPTKTYKF